MNDLLVAAQVDTYPEHPAKSSADAAGIADSASLLPNDGRCWYVLHSKPHHEMLVKSHLLRRGLSTFFPRCVLPPTPNRRASRVVPLFPSYLFVRLLVPDEYHLALWTPGVRNVVGAPGVPTPLDDDVVEFLVRSADPNGVVQARWNLAPGKVVRMIGGPFEGLMAVVERPPDPKGRVQVLMEMFRSRRLRVSVPASWVADRWIV